MGKKNAKKKAWRGKLTLLNILRKKMNKTKNESKAAELKGRINSIKSKL
jgi:hypothetical protein